LAATVWKKEKVSRQERAEWHRHHANISVFRRQHQGSKDGGEAGARKRTKTPDNFLVTVGGEPINTHLI
jgi:hypothetical protein